MLFIQRDLSEFHLCKSVALANEIEKEEVGVSATDLAD
jgi:hypothetical protein